MLLVLGGDCEDISALVTLSKSKCRSVVSLGDTEEKVLEGVLCSIFETVEETPFVKSTVCVSSSDIVVSNPFELVSAVFSSVDVISKFFVVC